MKSPPISMLAATSTLLLLTACSGEPPEPSSAPSNPAPFTVETRAGTKIHVIQTGWGAVKRAGQDASGPGPLRLLSTVLDAAWTEWFPINFYAIERKGDVLVFDTGETARIREEGYYRCDAMTEWVYLNVFRFSVAPEYELGPQLRRLGIDPTTVKWAVLSHLHADHIGGMSYLTEAEFLISRQDWGGHPGAVLCRIPRWVEPTLVDYDLEPFGAFDRSAAQPSSANPRPSGSKYHARVRRNGDLRRQPCTQRLDRLRDVSLVEHRRAGFLTRLV